jgi:hypothetical protein
MDNYLVMHLFCSECGNRLNFQPAGKKKVKNIDVYERSEPVHIVRRDMDVQVQPCRHCIDRLTGPALKILEGISEFARQKESE